MTLRGDERVLDAGCGTGRDALALRERWPDVHVVALDGSRRMLDVAREQLGTTVTYVHADLGEQLPLAELGGPVDAVMSVAAFHWVPDHCALFRHLAAVMRPGARLVSDCGGRGNIASLDAAVATVAGTPDEGWEFAGVEDTRSQLDAAGFEVRDVRLRPSPFPIQDPVVLEAYLATVCLGGYLAELPADEQEEFVHQVRLALPEPVVDYVRLEIDAVRR
jgi:trans-aconitate 2-methyltransferase